MCSDRNKTAVIASRKAVKLTQPSVISLLDGSECKLTHGYTLNKCCESDTTHGEGLLEVKISSELSVIASRNTVKLI
jgi:hypothetical protein